MCGACNVGTRTRTAVDSRCMHNGRQLSWFVFMELLTFTVYVGLL
jgi:hypothetical protein